MSTRSIAKTGPLRKLELGVAVFLAAMLAGFIVLSLTYPARARLFPLLVAVPSLLCMLLVIAAQFFDRADRIMTMFDTALFEPDSDMFDSEDETEIAEGQITRSVAWIVGALVAFYLFGFVLMTLVFVYAHLAYEGGHSRRESGIIAVVTTVVMFLLFVTLFGVRLDGGAVFVLLLDLLDIQLVGL